MKNLAGDKDCDIVIKEELYLAGVETIKTKSDGEVPYTFEGRIGHWNLRRAWSYWVASVERKEDGLIISDALGLHNTPHPTDSNRKIGDSVRCGGHAGAPSPDEYGASPIYNEQLNDRLKKLGYGETYSKALDMTYIPITVGEVSKLCKEGKLDFERYVDCYHIDDQIGLNEFVKFLNTKRK